MGGYILSHFDYADIMSDSHTDKQSNKPNKLHLEGARIILKGEVERVTESHVNNLDLIV